MLMDQCARKPCDVDCIFKNCTEVKGLDNSLISVRCVSNASIFTMYIVINYFYLACSREA